MFEPEGKYMYNCKRVPWVPIDPTVLLPYHHKHGRIPATFEPEGKYKRVPCFKQYLFGNCNQVQLQQDV